MMKNLLIERKIRNAIYQELLTESLNSAAMLFLKSRKDTGTIKTIEDAKKSTAFQGMVAIDPSPTKKYLDWLVKQDDMVYRAPAGSNTLVHDPFSNDRVIRDFDELVRKKVISGKESDINQYQSFADLGEVIEKAKKYKSRSFLKRNRVFQPKQMELEFNDDEADLIAATNAYYIVSPKSTEASCHYGKGTHWCIAGHGNTYFDQYYGDGNKIYFIIITDEDVLEQLVAIFDRDHKAMAKVAVVVPYGNRVRAADVFDGNDRHMESVFQEYCEMLQVDLKLFQPMDDSEYEIAAENSRLSEEEELELMQEGEREYFSNLQANFEQFLYDWNLVEDYHGVDLQDVIDYLEERYAKYGRITETEGEWNGSMRRGDSDNSYYVSSGLLRFLDSNYENQREEWFVVRGYGVKKGVGEALEDAMYYTDQMSEEAARKFEEDYPEKTRRPYSDADTYQQQELFEAVYRKILKMLKEVKRV